MPPDHDKLLSAVSVVRFYAHRAHSSRKHMDNLHNLMRHELAKVDRSRCSLRLLFAVDRVLNVTSGPNADYAMKEVMKACDIALYRPFEQISDRTWMEQIAGRTALLAQQSTFIDL